MWVWHLIVFAECQEGAQCSQELPVSWNARRAVHTEGKALNVHWVMEGLELRTAEKPQCEADTLLFPRFPSCSFPSSHFGSDSSPLHSTRALCWGLSVPKEGAGEGGGSHCAEVSGVWCSHSLQGKGSNTSAHCLQNAPRELSKLGAPAAAPGHSSDVSVCLRYITAVASVGSISQASPPPVAHGCLLSAHSITAQRLRMGREELSDALSCRGVRWAQQRALPCPTSGPTARRAGLFLALLTHHCNTFLTWEPYFSGTELLPTKLLHRYTVLQLHFSYWLRRGTGYYITQTTESREAPAWYTEALLTANSKCFQTGESVHKTRVAQPCVFSHKPLQCFYTHSSFARPDAGQEG